MTTASKHVPSAQDAVSEHFPSPRSGAPTPSDHADDMSWQPEGSAWWEYLFDLDPDGTPPEVRMEALHRLQEYLAQQQSNFLGYQAEQTLPYEKDLAWLLGFHVNNIGDPFTDGNFTINSKFVETRVLDYYAGLWHAKAPHNPQDPESYWGYVLSMGSTEGNMYALWNARDYLSGKALMVDPDSADSEGAPPRLVMVQAKAPEENPNAYTPVIFYSEDTHYSFTKASRLVGLATFYELGTTRYPGQCPLPGSKGNWPAEVPSTGGNDGPGTIDVDALCLLVDFFASRGYPIVVSLNFGSTFKGAYDPVERVTEAIVPIVTKYGLYERKVEYAPGKSDLRHGFWVHVDGALGAAYMPFLAMAEEQGTFRPGIPIPKFAFDVPHVFSLAMSGHKWIGAPWPCGIFMTKVKYQLRPPSIPVYVGSPDTTFAGSRNGFSPLVLWDHVSQHSYSDQIRRAVDAEEVAGYAYDKLRALSTEIGRNLFVARTPLALTVRFLAPNEEIIHKYSLSTEQYTGDPRVYAHLFAMHDVDRERIDRLIDDLRAEGAFEQPNSEVTDQLAAPGEPAQQRRDVLRIAHVPHTGRGFR